MALFDVDRRKVGGRSRTGVPIRDVAELPRVASAELGAEIGVLAVPRRERRRRGRGRSRKPACEAILNFAPIDRRPVRRRRR